LVYCGQMVGWIKMKLGMEVGPSPGDILLDGDPYYPHGKGHSTPHTLQLVYCGQRVAHLRNCWALVAYLTLKHIMRDTTKKSVMRWLRCDCNATATKIFTWLQAAVSSVHCVESGLHRLTSYDGRVRFTIEEIVDAGVAYSHHVSVVVLN